MKRSLAATLLIGIAIGVSGCQSTTLGGLTFFGGGNGSAASTAPDVSKQKYSGLSQQLAKSEAPSTGMGGNRTQQTGVFASLTKSTAAATSALTGKKIPEA